MDYKQQVIGSADKRFQDMVHGVTEPPIQPDLSVTSSKPYSDNRDGFMARLDRERKAFNDAINTTKACHAQRLLDKSNFGGIIATTIIFAILMGLFIFAYVSMDMQAWTNEVLLPNTGEHISEVFNLDGDSENLTGLISLIAGAIAFLGIAIFMFVSVDIDSCLGKLIAMWIGSAIGAVVVTIVFRLLIFVIGYLVYYLLQPWASLLLAAIAIVVILVLGRDLESGKYKTQKAIYCLVCLGIGLITAFIVFAV